MARTRLCNARAIAEIARPLAVFKNGRRTVVWHPPELMRPQQ